MMALSFKGRFSEIGARNLLMVVGGDRRGNAQTTLCFLFHLCGSSLPADAYLKFL